MALPIQGIPTLYGEEARRIRDMADEAELRYEERLRNGEIGDKTQDPNYQMVLDILRKSKLPRISW